MMGYMLADEALERFIADYAFTTVLDIGSGEGLHAERMRRAGRSVIELDSSQHWGGPTDIRVPFLDYQGAEPFDAVWCSHVLEHQLNVNLFLRRIFESLKPGGIFAITVPPMKPTIVGGHVTIWNAGLLLYNLILAGYDCRDVRIKAYGYNISVIGRKRRARLPMLKMDAGDIETLAPFFPVPVQQDFDGNIQNHGWDRGADPRLVAGPVVRPGELTIEMLRALVPLESDAANLGWSAACVSSTGQIAEFGVYKGTSLDALASICHDRRVAGFDSFRGLPEAWVRSDTSTYRAGHFALEAMPTGFPPNVKLFPGLFRDTVPAWRDTLDEPLALIHIDADLYSSTRDVLFGLDKQIGPGTVIVFDELCDWQDSGVYPNWAEGEWRALVEWMRACNRSIRILSRGPSYAATIVAV
jgi:hypothetical protein